MLHDADKLVEYSAIQISEELKQYYEKFVEYKKCSQISAEIASLHFQNEFNGDHKSRADCEIRYQNANNRQNEIREDLGLGLIEEFDREYLKANRSMTALPLK